MKTTRKSAARHAARLVALPLLFACGTVLAGETPAFPAQAGMLSLPNVTIQRASPEQATAASAKSAASAGIRAFKDPSTGRLRPATPEELEAIATETPAIAEEPVSVYRHSSGALVANVGESAMTYSVARKTADGRVDLQCVTGSEAARKSLGTKVAPKEHSHAH